jgi:dipeptidyl aminopeptidase/acylaminoacyl peptidase
MAQTTTIPITTVAAMLMVTIVLTGTTNVVSVWAGTFPGPNGQIAFVSLRDGNDEIYVMDAEGGDQTNLSNNDADDFNPSWSPDGEMIAFTSDRENGNFDIYVMNAADGSGQTTLTDNDAHDSDPDWGTNTSPPDGDGSSPAPSQQTTMKTSLPIPTTIPTTTITMYYHS